MRKSNVAPRLAEYLEVFCTLGSGIFLLPLSPANDALYLLRNSELDGIGHKEVAWNKRIEDG